MAELKTYCRRKKLKDQHIDHIPNYVQQRRSPGLPKRRTDFSIFLSNSHLHQESPRRKDRLSSLSIASLAETKDTKRGIIGLPQVRWTKNEDEIEGLLTSCVEIPVIEVNSVDPKRPFGRQTERCVDKESEDTPTTLDLCLNKSRNTDSDDACTTPGSVVWAKKACEVWWPAEIVGNGSTSVHSSFQGSDGHVLVQYYGNQESAWIDPASDISQFEDGFEERSCNPMEEFQDALKQALNQNENTNLGKQSSNSPDCSNQQDQSTTGGKCNSSSSSRTESDYMGSRSKRKIKPKLHFDDVMVPTKSPKKIRRLKIMRALGLAAPVGSLFSPAADDIFTSS